MKNELSVKALVIGGEYTGFRLKTSLKHFIQSEGSVVLNGLDIGARVFLRFLRHAQAPPTCASCDVIGRRSVVA